MTARGPAFVARRPRPLAAGWSAGEAGFAVVDDVRGRRPCTPAFGPARRRALTPSKPSPHGDRSYCAPLLVIANMFKVWYCARILSVPRHTGRPDRTPVQFSQLMVLARIRAQVVLPTPRGPQKRNACAS